MPHLTDIADPNRWPLTWTLLVSLADPDNFDADLDLRMVAVDHAIALGIGVESLGYTGAPATVADCRWYRELAGHDLGDLDYGRYLAECGACIEAR